MILASLVFALIAGLVLFAMLTGRLRRLTAAVETFRRGRGKRALQFSIKKKKHFPDEIDHLGLAFQEMARRIALQMDELKQSDASRRELIANVSHDIRTPLATLHAHIESMLIKEQGLSKDERKRYLEIALRHCERLGHLVNELFELARLDAAELSPRREAFSLSELVQDVIQKFRGQAEEKEIEIETRIEKGLPFADADIGLIERVLENLLENAIHYSPPKGSVRVIMAHEKDNIRVEVADTGYGIDKEELPHIFDRFYQLKKPRQEDGKHSGLGLAIAKKILELHERSIAVRSAVGAGTTFMFHLPVHNPS
jgi:signal transduction histidine kinase